MSCTWHDSGAVELYFYGELDARARARVEAHLGGCDACRAALADLEVIRRALAPRRDAAAPPGGDWGPVMRRLDVRLNEASAARARWTSRYRVALRIAATLAVAAAGVWAGFEWQRARIERATPAASQVSAASEASGSPVETLGSATDEHLARSKLVLLGLAAKDPAQARPSDWQYERTLASTLLADTTQYRLAATEQGRADLAGLLGDLETLLLQTSLGDESDPRALARLQRLIDRRDLLTKIEVVSAEGPGRAAGRGYEGRSRGHE